MGTACYETRRADRTQFIINEDYKIKQEMLKDLQNYVKEKRNRTQIICDRKNSEVCIKGNIGFPTSTFGNGNNDIIISKNKQALTDVYKLEGELGEGGYGKVFLVRHKKMKLLRAMKMVSVNCNNEGKTEEEIELLRQLDHPNIVKLFEYFSNNDKYYLITEYCKGGDLSELIFKNKKKLSEESAGYIMYQIFRALIYCHNTHHLVHRDIKPENIVVFRQNNAGEDLYDVKLIDFGISKIFNKLDKNEDGKVKGSLNYIAPEVILNKYDEKCDIWSCGVILYMLVIGKILLMEKIKMNYYLI
jgi:calcium-dependent protein kinase